MLSWRRASPWSPARPARARRWSSPGWACCSAAGPTPALVRAGAARTLVEGRLDARRAAAPTALRAKEAGAELDDGVLLIARPSRAEGRSRAHLGGRRRPSAVLGELADELVAVHGQIRPAAAARTGAPAGRAGPLRGPGGRPTAGGLPRRLRPAARGRAPARRARRPPRERGQEADLLRLGLAEVEAVDPRPGEDAALAGETARLGHAEALRDGRPRGPRWRCTGDEQRARGRSTRSAGWPRPGGRSTAVRGARPAARAIADRVAEASYAVADVPGRPGLVRLAPSTPTRPGWPRSRSAAPQLRGADPKHGAHGRRGAGLGRGAPRSAARARRPTTSGSRPCGPSARDLRGRLAEAGQRTLGRPRRGRGPRSPRR